MDNTIPRRIYDFLKDFPPFNLLDKEVLLLLCERVLVQYRRPEEVVFQQGDAPGSHIYVVREGAVQLLREVNGETILVEQCDEGDLFGLRPLLADDHYALTARVSEESLLYAINVEGFREVVENNPRIAFYLASNYAAGIGKRYNGYKPSLFLEKDKLIDSNFPLLE
nr:cyclic nucleotide-binding domain-containing protein [Saprospiraceae bacterium]